MEKNLIRLRSLTMEDAAITWRWRNQDGVRNDFSGHPFPVSYEEEKSWYEKNIHVNFPNTTFGVESVRDNRLVGMTFLKNINLIHRNAEFAILIDEQSAGNGFGKAACHKTVDFAFHNLGLHRVYLKVRKDNSAAIRIYEACGFKLEGTLRDDIFKQGNFNDQLVMAVLEGEFPER
jgi:RimJ/RimL family protein N-acetyltransferase